MLKATFQVLLVVAVLAGSAVAVAVQKLVKRSTYVDANYGFSLETPRFPGATRTTPGTVFFAAGPPADGSPPRSM